MQALLEQGLVYILKRVLGEFVEQSAGLQDKIQVGISTGSIVLEDLVLKNSILSLVDVPISLSYGSIGKFELRIPWSKIGVDPIVVVIERVNVLVEPKYEWSRGAVDKREQAVKQAKLAAAELFAAKRLVNKTRSYTDFAKSWFMTSFVNKIIDNIQITVREVHFRYEDHVSCPSRFCIGFSLESLTVRTRDGELTKQMEEQFPPVVKDIYSQQDADTSYEKYNIVTAGTDTFDKVIAITNLAMYWNPLVSSSLDVCSCCFIGRPAADIQSFMSRTLATGTAYIDKPRHHYILLPVDIHTYLSFSLNTTTGVVKATVNVFMSNISLSLEDRQLREIISMATYMANFAKLERFSEFRPTRTVAQDPAAWWRYAINAVIVQIRIDRKSTLTWKQLHQRSCDKLVYVELWKSRLVSSQGVINQLNTFDTTKRTLDRAANPTYLAILKRVRKEIADSKAALESITAAKGAATAKASVHATPKSRSGSVASGTGRASTASAASLASLASPLNVTSAASVPLTKEGIELLKALEYDLSFEDIVQFRSKAEKNLSLEAKQKSWMDGIASWVTGGKQSSESIEDKLKLFEALKYDPDRVFRGGNQEVDLNEVMANVSVTLRKGSFTMALSTPDVNTFQSSLPFLKLQFDDLKNKNVIMGDGSHMKIFLSLQDFEAFEVVSANNMKRFVFRRTLAQDLPQGASVADSVNDDARSVVSTSVRSASGRRGSPKDNLSGKRVEAPRAPPLIATSIDVFPPNKEKDTAVYLSLEELEVWISPFATWFDPMSAFVAWPDDLKYWSEMEMTTLNQLADFKSRIDAKLEYMMNNHMNILMEARVKAPVIIVTDSEFKDDTADVLVVDLGSITLKTEKLAKAQRQKVIDAQNAHGGNSDANSSIRNSLPTTPVLASSSKRLKAFRTPTVAQSIIEEENEEEADLPAVAVPVTNTNHVDGFELLNASGMSGGGLAVGTETPINGTPTKAFNTPSELGELADENYTFGATDARRSSVYHRYLPDAEGAADAAAAAAPAGEGVGVSYYGQSIKSAPSGEMEEVLNEEDLFDVFLCKMRDSEVYLINAAMVHNIHAEVEHDKTVIVDRSEMSIEIQVSVLPWDTTLPPVKLFVDMDELNIQLSEPKLLRLNQFAMGLVNRSNNIIKANMKSINKFNNLMKRRMHDSLGSRMRTSGVNASFLNTGHSSLAAGSRLSTGSIYRAQRLSHKHAEFTVPDDASTFYDAKSELGSVKPGDSDRRSVGSSRLMKLVEGGRHVVSDDDDANSEDSFFSVEENYSTRDRVRQAEELSALIAEKENAQMKLMSDIRVTESDPTKAQLLEIFRQDMVDLERDLKTLRIRFIELRMHTNELENFIAADASQRQQWTEKELAERKHLVDQLIFPQEGVTRQDLGHKRNLIHASVFKITQEPNQYSNADVKYKPTDERLSEFMNKKLVYAKVNIAVVNVDLHCVHKVPAVAQERLDASKTRRSSAFSLAMPSHPVDRTVVFRLKLAGIHMTLKHKSMDSKILFVLHQIDLLEFALSNSVMPFAGEKANSYSNQTGAGVLISSEPSLFGMFGVPLSSKYLQNGATDFVRVKYDVSYADTSLPVDSPANLHPVTTHDVSVTSGFLGLNIEQHKISLLLDSVTSLSSVIAAGAGEAAAVPSSPHVKMAPAAAAASSSSSQSPLPPIITDSPTMGLVESGSTSNFLLAQLPTINLTLNVDCVTVSLLSHAEPLLTVSVWQIGSGFNSQLDHVKGSLEVSDVTVDYTSPSGGLESSLLSRQMGSSLPFLSLTGQFEVEESRVYMPNLTVDLQTVPLAVNINLDAIHDVTRHVVHGPVYKFVSDMSKKSGASATVASSPPKAPAANPSGATGLDAMLNPLLDLCNGTVTLTIGCIAVTAPSSSEYIQSNSDFALRVESVVSRTAWGDFCRCGGLESSLTVKSIGVKVSSWSLCDPFDVTLASSLLPLNLLGMFPNSSLNSATFEYPALYPPPELPPIDKNEMQISVGISPINLHCNDAIIGEAVNWAANTDLVLQRIAALVASEPSPPHQAMADLLSKSLPPSSTADEEPLSIGFVLTAALKVYEVTLAVEVSKEPLSPRQSSFDLKTPLKTPVKHGSSFSFLNVDPSSGDKVTTVFRMTTRNIGLSASIEDCITTDADEVVDAELLFNVEDSEAAASQSFIEVQVGIETLDVEFLTGSHKAYKRMLFNSALLSKAEAAVPFLAIAVDVSNTFDLTVEADLSNVHVAVIPEAVVALLALLKVYEVPAAPQLDRKDVLTPVSKMLTYETKSQAGRSFRGESASLFEHSSAGTASRQSLSGQGRESYSHPSSVPMSTTAEAARAPNAFANLQALPPSNVPATLLHRQSFCLPAPLKSVSVRMSVSSLHLWVPGDGGPGSRSLCCSLDSVTVTATHQDIQWLSYAQAREACEGGRSESQLFWTSQLLLCSFGVCLTDIFPHELTCSLHKLHTDPPVFPAAGDHVPESKVLISPFDLSVQYDLKVRSASTEPTIAPVKSGSFVMVDGNLHLELQQVLSVVIQDITAHVYLDYQPFLRLYESTSAPINLYFSSLGSSSTAVKKAPDLMANDTVDRFSLGLASSEHATGSPMKAPSSAKKTPLSSSKFGERPAAPLESVSRLLKERKMASVDSVFDLFACLPLVSSLSVSVQQDNISVFVINDIYMQQPVSIARLSVSELDVQVQMSSPPRESGVMVVSNASSGDRSDDKGKDRSNSTSSVSSSMGLFDFGVRASLGRVQDAFKDFTSGSQLQLASASVDTAPLASPLPAAVCSPLLTVVAKSSMRVDYYNQKLIATEPLIEPFASEIVFSLFNAPDEAKKNGPILTLLNESSTSGSSVSPLQIDAAVARLVSEYYLPKPVLGGGLLPPPPCLRISTLGNVNVNLTVSLFELVFLTMKALNYLEASALSGGVNLKDISMLAIRNETGMMIKYWTKEKTQTEEVPTNSEVPLNLVEFDLDSCGLGVNKDCWVSGGSGGGLSSDRSIHVGVQRPSGEYFPSLLDIPMDGEGCRLFVLELDSAAADKEGGASRPQEKHKRRRPHSLHHHSGQRENSGLELRDAISTPNSTIVAMELISKAGIKTLLIRSTMRLFNSTKIAFRVELVCGYRNVHRDVLWEAVVPPNSGIAVPAHLCNVENGRFIVKPNFDFSKSGSQWAQQYYRVSSQRSVVFSAELPVPDILGSTAANSKVTQDEEEDYQDGNNYIFNERDDALPRNFIKWRKAQTHRKELLDSMTYSHWVRFNKNNSKSTDNVNRSIEEIMTYCQEKSESVCCNVNVESRGVPHLSKTKSPESCLLRTLVFAPSLTVTNMMAQGIEVVVTPNIGKYIGKTSNIDSVFKANRNLVNIIPGATLRPSESWDCVSYHSSEKIMLSLKLTHDISSNADQWSNFLVIPGSRVNSSEVTSYTVDIPYRNGSVLPVQVEVADSGGARAITIFVPYWVVTSSFLPIRFQHEPRAQTSAAVELPPLNGEDGLAADQVYEDKRAKTREEQLQLAKKVGAVAGLGHSRGVNGVVLGPGTPLRGLTDVLKASPSGIVSRFSIRKADEQLSPLGLLNYYLNNPNQDQHSTHSDLNDPNSHLPMDVAYRLMQCGYSNTEKRSCRLRLGTSDGQWGGYFSLDRVGNTDVDLTTSTEVSPSTAGYQELKSKTIQQNYCFGVVTSPAEAPFQRTKIVTIVDRLLLINSVGQAIEVRQFEQDSVFSLKNNDETALWWRPGKTTIQVRLARYGWSWSGKFSVTIEGEIPIRLRNDFDNTVFFVLVEVVRQGPRICIVFKSGEKFSPYRFENHTLETFKIRQKGQAPVTNLLPYHCSAYAWDEPLAEHMFTIEMAKGGTNADNLWTTVGTFSFDRLEVIERKASDHLVLKVLAQGPTRVLQIHDSRSKRVDPVTVSPVKRYRGGSAGERGADAAAGALTNATVVKPVLFHVLVHIQGLGVSLVDQTPQELIYLSLSGCSVDLSIGEGHQSVDLDLECLQIDNQLWSTPYPSLFYPLLPEGAAASSTSPNSSTKHAGVHNSQTKFLSLSVTRDFEYSGIEFLPLFKLTLSPFDVNVEGTILLRLYGMGMCVKSLFEEASSGSAVLTKQFDWLDDISRSSTSKAAAITYQDLKRLERTTRAAEAAAVAAAAPEAAAVPSSASKKPLVISIPSKGDVRASSFTAKHGLGRQQCSLIHGRIKKILAAITTLPASIFKPSPKIYFKQMEISEIRLNVSMNATISEYIRSEDSWYFAAIKQVLISVGSTLTKLENCPIKFYQFSLTHSYCSDKELAKIFLDNYTGQAIVQSVNVLFSSEVLGNPLMLFRNMSEGLYDFIRLPVEGLTQSPQAFAFGVYRGTSSLLRRTVASFCTAVGHFSSVGQVALLTLGLVEAYPRSKPAITDAEDGTPSALIEVRTGGRANAGSQLPSTFVAGFVFGWKQVVLDPYVGMKSDGLKGALTGIVKGVLGVLARPAYGGLGYLSASLNSLSFALVPRFHAAQKLRIQRFRPPRFLHSPNLPLQVYSVDENVGQELLLRIHKGEYRYEGYVCHSRVREGYVLIMTKMRIMLVNESFDFCELLWQCVLRSILSIEVHWDKAKTEGGSAHSSVRGSARSSPALLTPNLRATASSPSDKITLNSSLSKDKNQPAKWTCKLTGEPTLHVYYRPPSPQDAAKPAEARDTTTAASPSSGEPSGLRFAQKVLSMHSHDQLLSFMYQLLVLSPALLSPDLTHYLSEAGVDQALLRTFSNKKKTAVGLRSPNRGGSGGRDAPLITSRALNPFDGSQSGSGTSTVPRRLSSYLRSTSSVNSATSAASSDTTPLFGAVPTDK